MKKKKPIKEHKINTHGSWRYTEVLWRNMIGLCKKLNIIFNIITCNPELQSDGSERIIILNQFFLVNWMNQFTKTDWTVWNSSRLKQQRSTSHSIKTHFQMPDSHSESKGAKIVA